MKQTLSNIAFIVVLVSFVALCVSFVIKNEVLGMGAAIALISSITVNIAVNNVKAVA